ncbi:hypothetical protein C7S14_5209 [Burkholderia cepacia]|nr:hypothetical protein C7S14_5209 [Burkholderia cepacia]
MEEAACAASGEARPYDAGRAAWQQTIRQEMPRSAQPSERKTRDGSNAVAGFSCFLAAEAPVFPARAGRYY